MQTRTSNSIAVPQQAPPAPGEAVYLFLNHDAQIITMSDLADEVSSEHGLIHREAETTLRRHAAAIGHPIPEAALAHRVIIRPDLADALRARISPADADSYDD